MDVDELLKKMNITLQEYETFKEIIADAKKFEIEMKKLVESMRQDLEEHKRVIDLLNSTIISNEIYEFSKKKGET